VSDRGQTGLRFHALKTLSPCGVPFAAVPRETEVPLGTIDHPQVETRQSAAIGGCLSCFIQTPPSEFKDHKRLDVCPAVLTSQSWGQSCSGLQGSVTQIIRRHFATVPLSQTLLFSASSQGRLIQTKRQRVTHPTACKQTTGEEGTPTCPQLAINQGIKQQ
jgi:hypothetical protein